MKPRIFWVCLLTVIFGCQKNITVVPPSYADKVSIQSFIETDSLPIVYFNKTVPYFNSAIKNYQLTIRSAVVRIITGSDTTLCTLDSTFNKIDCQYTYYYIGHKPIKANLPYQLSIVNGVDTFTASAKSDIIPPVIDSVRYIAQFNDINGQHEGVIVYFTDKTSQSTFYRYEMLRHADTSTKLAESPIVSTCLGSDSVTVQEIGRAVFNNEGLQGKQIKIVAEPGYSHKAGTRGMVYMQAFDKNAYDFFKQLDDQKIAANNPFVEPVFLLPGQFGTRAFGYFSAKKNSTPTLFVYPE